MDAPVAIYYTDGALSLYDIGQTGAGTLALSVAPETLRVGETVEGQGSTVTRLDEETVRISAEGGSYTFDLALSQLPQ
jgi:hypothetical protein